MLIPLFLTLYTFITWKRFDYGVFLFFLLLPTYLIRLSIGPLPTTLLELMLLVLLAVFITQFIVKNLKFKIRSSELSKYKSLIIATLLFLLAATIGVFVSTDIRAAAGEWKAFYVQPILLALMLVLYAKSTKKNLQDITQIIILPLLLCGLATSVLAIYQHFTGWMVPWDFWENRNTFRVTGWYGFPNAVGLFLAPLVPLAVFTFLSTYKNKQFLSLTVSGVFLLLCPLSLIYAKGAGPIIGVAGGIGALLLLYKKTRVFALSFGALAVLLLAGMPTDNPLKQEVLLQDRSGQIRVEMWGETIEYLTHHPILGTGLASYQEKLWPYRINKWIEIFHHPHNIFLTMWVNIGLLGLFAFVWLLVWFYKNTLLSLHPTQVSLKPFLLASMTVFVIAGLVDSPYIKNDLSIVFWTLIALLVISNFVEKRRVG